MIEPAPPKKLSLGALKVQVGKMVRRSVAATPNHWAKVAAYWSSEVVGTPAFAGGIVWAFRNHDRTCPEVT